jgi:hypothetical protein
MLDALEALIYFNRAELVATHFHFRFHFHFSLVVIRSYIRYRHCQLKKSLDFNRRPFLAIWANHDDIIDRVAWARYVNRATAALRDIFNIIKHFQSPFSFLLILHSVSALSKKRNREIVGEVFPTKIFSFGMIFAGGSLAWDLLCLPFWQKTRPICHFGSHISLATAIMSADRIG